jgi:DnaK suppressor protein
MATAKTKQKTTSKNKVKPPSAKSPGRVSAPARKSATVKEPQAARTGKKPAARTTPVKPVKAVPKKKTAAVPANKRTGHPENRLSELRKDLQNKKETILKEAREEIAKYVNGDNRQLVDTALDEGDWAQVDISEDINLQRLAAHRKLLHDIDEAIRKITEGTYGICEECGEEISEKRLRILPAATLCIDCKESKEQFEALETPE